MKRLIIILAIALIFPLWAVADSIVLDTPEVLSTPNAIKLDWYVDKIDAKAKLLVVKYRWLDSTGTPIFLGDRNTWQTWSARNKPDNPITDPTLCTSAGVPFSCCAGVGTGDCDESTTDFSAIFAFNIRAQDVGTSIGAGLRTLIWNKMKADVLTGGNDGTFEN